VNAALVIKYERDAWKHMLGFTGNYGSDGSVTTAPTPSALRVTKTTGSVPTTTRPRWRAVLVTASSTTIAPGSGCRAVPAIASPSCASPASPRTA
jgi:hypothetical protein